MDFMGLIVVVVSLVLWFTFWSFISLLKEILDKFHNKKFRR